jgi:peptidoglycan-N-acetylmuramic acid deacetylase
MADWETDNQPDEAQALEKILSSTHNGEIMLLHAVSETNANIMGEIIDGIRNQGYQFTTEL